MRLLPGVLLVPALNFAVAVAIPDGDIVGLLAGNNDVPTTLHATRPVFPTVKPISTPSTSPSGELSSSTSHPPSTEQRAPTSTPSTVPVESTTLKTTLTSTPTPPILPVSAESHAPDRSSKTWQIIGIVIIAVLFVATSITCAMSFDRLWRFLRDVVGCTPRPPLFEEFIPDYEKQAWDTRTLSPSPSDFDHSKTGSLREEASACTTRARELPWNADAHDWSTLYRQPSRRNDHPPST